MRESDLMRQVLAYLNLAGVWHYRQNTGAMRIDGRYVAFGQRGLPDIVAVVDGRYIGIECKGKRGRQTDEQKAVQASLERAGGLYLLVRDLDDLRKAIE